MTIFVHLKKFHHCGSERGITIEIDAVEARPENTTAGHTAATLEAWGNSLKGRDLFERKATLLQLAEFVLSAAVLGHAITIVASDA